VETTRGNSWMAERNFSWRSQILRVSLSSAGRMTRVEGCSGMVQERWADCEVHQPLGGLLDD